MYNLQFLEFFQLRKETSRQLTDTVFVYFKLIQLNQRLKCASFELRNLIVVQKSAEKITKQIKSDHVKTYLTQHHTNNKRPINYSYSSVYFE